MLDVVAEPPHNRRPIANLADGKPVLDGDDALAAFAARSQRAKRAMNGPTAA